MTRADLYILRAQALKKYSEYFRAEEALWGKNGFINMSFYKAFRKAKSAFHNANQQWEVAFLDYINDYYAGD